ncbi:bpX6 domain-containing protein [Myxococcus fulvus]|uniref:bpX6 domain-containing protein n=1 Tax=Myxococcus fulvus TaxID=33 RepID=UPI003B9B64F0
MRPSPSPRQHLHRGTVSAVAFWFDPVLLSEAEARRRVMSLWAPGASVLWAAEGYLLRLPVARRCDAGTSPGLALTLERGVLVSAPLSSVEWERVEARPGSLVLVRGGRTCVYPVTGALPVDVSSWLDVSAWTVVPTRGLGAPPAPVASAVEPKAPLTRAFFGATVPELSTEAKEVLARMQGRVVEAPVVVKPPGWRERLRAAFGRSGASGVGATAQGGLLSRLRAALGPGEGALSRRRGVDGSAPGAGTRSGVLSRLRASFGRGAASGEGARSGPISSASAARREASAGWWSRLRAAFGSRGSGGAGGAAARESAALARSSGGSTGRWLGRFAAWLGSGVTSSEGAHRDALTSAKPSWLGRWLSSLFSTVEDAQPSGAGTGARAQAPGPRPEPPSPGVLSRLSRWLIHQSPLSHLLLRRKAEYLRRLFEMFEDGDLQEALRHAVPLGAGAPDTNTREALGLPGPREKLTLQLGPRGPATTFAGGEDLYEALRQRYRTAFQRFEREGRIDEAVFVLSELLGAHLEAVAFLEKHGRFQLAAELAEGRALGPGLVVRQWFLAKDPQRAVAIARRSGCFSDAVLRLERTHPEEARALRLLWAQDHAAAGNWSQAVQVIWPVVEKRELAREWLERGVEVGGPTGARLLARWACALPEGLSSTRARVVSLLDDETPQGGLERLTFAEALSQESASATRATLLLPTVRALLKDRAAGRAHVSADLLDRLVKELLDGALRADLPTMPAQTLVAWGSDPNLPPVVASASLADAGPHSIHDAVALSGGRVLLALGEAGAVLLNAEGRRLAHLDVPAFSLVASLHGDRVLALAPRGELYRVSRVDVMARRATHWCDLAMESWAPTYDGGSWFVVSGHTVMMLDAQAPDARALWRVAEVPGTVRSLAADESWLSFTTSHLERWTYELYNGPTLRARGPLVSGQAEEVLGLRSCALTPDGEARAAVLMVDEGPLFRRVDWLWLPPNIPRQATPWVRDDEFGEPVHLVLSSTWRAEVVRCVEGWDARLLDTRGVLRARLTLTFEGDTPPRVRLGGSSLLVYDVHGRVLCLDLKHGTVRHVVAA